MILLSIRGASYAFYLKTDNFNKKKKEKNIYNCNSNDCTKSKKNPKI